MQRLSHKFRNINTSSSQIKAEVSDAYKKGAVREVSSAYKKELFGYILMRL
jgi:hypothetical protein